ncbi:MAG: hypothetical protein IJC84_06365 [Clostridia bacterium]|nr:hypothetical protein [Clostridia bacterium]
MTKQKTTKRALLLSALSLLLCVSMLIGSTFAWFTDSVSTGNTVIQSGTLDIVLEYSEDDGATWKDAEGKTLNFLAADGRDEILWEPGCTYELPLLRVRNNGNLALKYKIVINGIDGDAKLLEAIDFTANGTAVNVFTGHLDTTNAVSETVLLVGHMKEEAGNEYQGLEADGISVTVFATQQTYESDSEDNLYDEDAEFPVVASGTKTPTQPLTLASPLDDGYAVEVTVPAAAVDGSYALVIPPESIQAAADAITFSMHLELNGKKVEPPPGVEYVGSISLPHPFVTVSAVYHNGEKIAFDHSVGESVVTFRVSDFSPFAVEFVDHTDPSFPVSFAEENGEYRIFKGVFVDFDPAQLDPTLDDADSQYIAVEYAQGGAMRYMICERASTIIVGDADDEGGTYYTENKNYTVKLINDNTLHTSAVEPLNAMEGGTLLIFPGTYEEQRRLEPTSSMTIIGLGDKEDIKLIKTTTTSTSSSHQHLINCNGNANRADYIRVTIRNLSLDSSVGNGSGFIKKDNGAVQVIRKAQVKCYDLVIRDSGFPFYVNATNAAYDGALYSAYMYVENTVVSGNSILTYSGNKTESAANLAYFTHYGLTYANGSKEYTDNKVLSGRDGICYVANEKMAAEDWLWD